MKIARLFGINVQIHWTFWLLPIWVVLTFPSGSEMFSLPITLLVIAALFACVVMHEFGHALTARRFGIRTRNITLTPLGGIAQLERMSHEPWEEFWIAIAGPAVNVVLAFLLAVPLGFSLALNPEIMASTLWRFGAALLALNVMMVLFNMIPAFPMDGGRVLRAVLAGSMGLLEGTRVAVRVGAVFAVLMAVVGVFTLNLILALIALFVYWAGRQELLALEAAEEPRAYAESMESDAEPVFAPRPRIVVHVWDPRRHTWVRQPDV